MDPNACLEWLKKAVIDGDTDRAAELRESLRMWVTHGGFPPDDKNWRSY